MLNKYTNEILAKLMLSFIIINVSYASGISSFNVSAYLNNTLLQGQSIPPLISSSHVQWNIATIFNGSSQNINASINQTAINYTDSKGTISTSRNPVQVTWNTNPEVATYSLNGSKSQPIYVLSANTLLGSVSQFGLYSSATTAPQCSTNQLYTEWDFQVTVYGGYYQASRNVVVGRVCFYAAPIGYSQPLPKSPSTQISSTLTLTSGAQQENLLLNNTSTYVKSSDGLASVQGNGNYVSSASAPPNGTGYVAINSTQNNQWRIHDNGTYSQWYSQYYSFAQNFIPKQAIFYSPSNIGILSQNCNVVSNSALTNQSVYTAVQCMNTTAKTYYSQANFYANQLISTTQNVSVYPTSTSSINGKPSVVLALPTVFISQPKLTLLLSGSFIGLKVPAGKPQIFGVSSTTLNAYGIGTITTQMENVGNSPALFNVSIENCPGISTPSGVNYMLLQGQGEEITTAVISSNSSKIINQQCTVVVNDLTGGGSASATVNISSGTAEQIVNFFSNLFKGL